MTKNLNRALATVTTEAPAIGHNGAPADASRLAAFEQVEKLAMAGGSNRRNIIIQLVLALGDAPSDGEKEACRKSYIVGRVAGHLAPDALPAGHTSPAKRLAFAEKVYASPKLRTGDVKLAYNAAKSSWSPLLSECGHGNAQTVKTKNAKGKKRGARAEGNAKETVAPQETATPKTPADVMAFIAGQSNVLAMYCKKHAKLVPTSVGEAVNALARISAGQVAETK